MTTTGPAVAVVPARIDEQFEAILGLYEAHGWIHAADPPRLRRAIESSATSLVAIENGEVVGYARAMSDRAFAVYIADILVRPDRQRRGIGSALFRAILDRYPIDVYHHQVLISERGAEGFYRRHGLMPIGSYGLTAFIRTRD